MSHVNVSTRDMSVARLVVFMIGCAAVSTSVLAQPTGDSAPRTAWGVPDVQGFWHLDTLTPLERPSGFESTPRVTGEEAAAFLQQRRDAFNRQYDAILSADFFAGRAGAADDIGVDPLLDGRTSLVVDPPSGRIPRTDVGQERLAASGAGFSTPPAGPEDRHLQERCLSVSAVPLAPIGFGMFPVMILQTPDHVVLYHEFINEAIIAPLDGRPALPANVGQLHGASRASWEGDTLVIESTNFDGRWTFQGSGPDLRVVQRLRRVSQDTLDYSFTVEDATSFTRPWTADYPFTLTDWTIYEYACHEGNRSMTLALQGTRAQEAAASNAR